MTTPRLPRRQPRQPRSEKSWTRRQVVDAIGYVGPDAIYQVMATHPTDPPCPCCGGFPRPFRALGPGGFPRWRADKIEAWLERMHANAQKSERKPAHELEQAG